MDARNRAIAPDQAATDAAAADMLLLSADMIAALKHQNIETKGELDARVQANLESGLAWLADRGDAADILGPAFFKELHFRLFGEVWRRAGNLREAEQQGGADPDVIDQQLEALLDNARFWAANGVYPALEAAALFHHRLARLRFFDLGNTHHAAIATDLFLRKYFDFPPVTAARGKDIKMSDQRRKLYADALTAADGGDITPLMDFFHSSDAGGDVAAP